MRILFIVPYAPSLIRVRPYQLIRALASRGHEITVACVWSPGEDLEGLRRLDQKTVQIRSHRLPRWRPAWNCLRTLPSGKPMQAAFSWSPRMMSQVRQALQEQRFDIVHVEHLRGALYGLGVLRTFQHGTRRTGRGCRRIPVVWDSVDCISHLFEQAKEQSRSLKGRLMTHLELRRTRRFEGWLSSRFDHVLATSGTDRDALMKLRANWEAAGRPVPEARVPEIGVLANGVDLDYFRPAAGPREPATLVFSGKMSYHANITAAKFLVQEIMPRVWDRRDDVRVVIAGKNPPNSIVSMADRVSNRTTPASEGGVEVTGTVPDLRPHLQRATISIVPLLYGAGIQNKVLEALACGTPVIASPRAVSSLSGRSGSHFLVANDADTFARTILELLEDQGRRTSLGRAGREFVEKHHDWNVIGGHLEEIYLRLIDPAQGLEIDGEAPQQGRKKVVAIAH